ncbi:hypothetical protein KM043_012495 [Ampulex compressa]|nr:hypothetical protein KM043_012495 [Ampulex compressa]
MSLTVSHYANPRRRSRGASLFGPQPRVRGESYLAKGVPRHLPGLEVLEDGPKNTGGMGLEDGGCGVGTEESHRRGDTRCSDAVGMFSRRRKITCSRSGCRPRWDTYPQRAVSSADRSGSGWRNVSIVAVYFYSWITRITLDLRSRDTNLFRPLMLASVGYLERVYFNYNSVNNEGA